MRLAVADLVAATGGTLHVPTGRSVPAHITGVTTDSRTVRPGDLFVALRGPRTDGHRFVGEALARGAALAVVGGRSDGVAEAHGPLLIVPDTLRAFGAIAGAYRRTLPVTVVGITGSVGKTTTVAICAGLLERRFVTARSAESWNAEIGVAMTLLGLRPEHEVAVVEMAMRGPGQIRELVALALPRIGAVTNIGDTHLELLGSRDAIASAKAELLEGLPADGVAVVNADDPCTPRLLRDVRGRAVRAGLAPGADVRAADLRPDGRGTRFALTVGEHVADAWLPLPGRHQVSNALVAAAVAWVLGLTAEAIVAGLAEVRPPKMRQVVERLDDVLLVDDAYNASPQSATASFEVLVRVAGGRRRVLALGEMLELGPAAPEFHREVGRQAAALDPAFLLAVGPNARWYLEGAQAAGLPASRLAWTASAAEAGPLLRAALRPGDAVLVKGSRGIAMEQVVAALRDRAAASRP